MRRCASSWTTTASSTSGGARMRRQLKESGAADRGRGPAAGLVADGDAPGPHAHLRGADGDACRDGLARLAAQPALEELGHAAAVAAGPHQESVGHEPSPTRAPRGGSPAAMRRTTSDRPPTPRMRPASSGGLAASRPRSACTRSTWRCDPGGVSRRQPLGLRLRRAPGQHDDDLAALGHGQPRAPRPIASGAPRSGGRSRHGGRRRRSADGWAWPPSYAARQVRARRRSRHRRRGRSGGPTPTVGAAACRGPAEGRVRCRPRGDSSAGRASAWQAEGPGFESPSLHHPAHHRTLVSRRGSRRLRRPEPVPRARRMSENAGMTSPSDPDTETARPRIDRYDPTEIEPRWQQRWEELGLHDTDLADESRPRYYLLTMYPYPSGDLHIGHWYIVTPTDARARFLRMNGHNVFFPIGFDAFGLPAENAAIKSGVHPATWTMRNIENMRRQFRTMGATLDWSAEVVTCEPDVLPLEPVVLPAVPEGRPGLPADGAGRLVPQGPGRAGPRAGRGRRPRLLALRHAGHQARPGAVVLPHHQVRRRAARLRGHRLARAGAPHADELDRPLGGRRGRLPHGALRRTTPAARSSASSRPGRTRSSGPPSWSSPPSTPWWRS